jgi:octaprenyl-diphosphate synthase
MSTTITLENLYQSIAEPLDCVRGEVGQLWMDALELVNLDDVPKPKTSGKMLRPALCLLAAGAIGGKDLRQYAKLASAFEALHIASLAHDDVIDKAILRRNDASLNSLWDNHAAVLGGDYLVARAVEFLCTYDVCEVVSNAITSVRRMAEGELYFFGRDEDTITETDCLMLSKQKTASLFAEACAASTYVIDMRYRDSLHSFGIDFGVAFQVIDDLLDLTQPTSNLGKPACGDVAEGKITLPILYMREALDAADKERLAQLHGSALRDSDSEWLQEAVEQCGARERTESIARRHAQSARDHLATLPQSEYREAIEGLLEFLLIRVS